MIWSNWILEAKEGDPLVFLSANGQDYELQAARTHLKTGVVYTIKQIEVGNWRTLVELREVPGLKFNSVHFSPAPNGLDRAVGKLPT